MKRLLAMALAISMLFQGVPIYAAESTVYEASDTETIETEASISSELSQPDEQDVNENSFLYAENEITNEYVLSTGDYESSDPEIEDNTNAIHAANDLETNTHDEGDVVTEEIEISSKELAVEEPANAGPIVASGSCGDNATWTLDSQEF